MASRRLPTSEGVFQLSLSSTFSDNSVKLPYPFRDLLPNPPKTPKAFSVLSISCFCTGAMVGFSSISTVKVKVGRRQARVSSPARFPNPIITPYAR